MQQTTKILLVTSLLGLLLVGLVMPVTMAAAGRTSNAAASESKITIHMSSSEGGPAQRTFAANATRIYAVVTYEDAVNEFYVVRLTDLLGMRVLSQPVGPLTGSGVTSVPVSAERFMQTYRSAYGDMRDQAVPDSEAIVDACANRS